MGNNFLKLAFKNLLLLLIVNLSAHAQEEMTPQAWLEDINAFEEAILTRHAKPFTHIEKTEFQQEIKDLKSKSADLTDADIIYSLARIAARLKEGHTGLFLGSNNYFPSKRLPFEIWPTSDGWTIITATENFQHLIGQRIVEIGGLPLEEIKNRISPYIPHDNQFGLAWNTVRMAGSVRALTYLGLAKSEDKIVFLLEKNGALQEYIVPGVDASAKTFTGTKNQTGKLWLKNRDQRYWHKILNNGDVLYVQLSSSTAFRSAEKPQFEDFLKSLIAKTKANPLTKIIIDMRWNSGGNYPSTSRILNAVIKAGADKKPNFLYVLTSPVTFSSGAFHTAAFEFHTDAIFAGEPTGGRPAWVGENSGPFRLPNSRIPLVIPRAVHTTTTDYDHRPAFYPDLWVPFSSDDISKGTDPALDAVINHNQQKSLSDILGQFKTENPDGDIVKYYKNLKKHNFNSIRFNEDQLYITTRNMLKSKQYKDALTMAKLFHGEYNYSLHALKLKADALLGLKKFDEAQKIYEAVHVADKFFFNIPDILKKIDSQK